jgi:hypothetical protein
VGTRLWVCRSTPAAAAGAAGGILDWRCRGGAWTLGQLWSRLGIGAAPPIAAAGRNLDADLAEWVVLALVAQRTWIRQRAGLLSAGS